MQLQSVLIAFAIPFVCWRAHLYVIITRRSIVRQLRFFYLYIFVTVLLEDLCNFLEFNYFTVRLTFWQLTTLPPFSTIPTDKLSGNYVTFLRISVVSSASNVSCCSPVEQVAFLLSLFKQKLE